jgi:hypothetical protein
MDGLPTRLGRHQVARKLTNTFPLKSARQTVLLRVLEDKSTVLPMVRTTSKPDTIIFYVSTLSTSATWPPVRFQKNADLTKIKAGRLFLCHTNIKIGPRQAAGP